VRINQDAGLKRAARDLLEMQDAKIAKKSPSAHHRTTLSGYIFTAKALQYYILTYCAITPYVRWRDMYIHAAL